MQDSQLLLKFMVQKDNTMTNDLMSGVITHLMTSIKEYMIICWPSQTIAELLLEGQDVDWNHFDINKFNSRLDSIKAVLNTAKCTKDIGNRSIC